MQSACEPGKTKIFIKKGWLWEMLLGWEKGKGEERQYPSFFILENYENVLPAGREKNEISHDHGTVFFGKSRPY